MNPNQWMEYVVIQTAAINNAYADMNADYASYLGGQTGANTAGAVAGAASRAR